MSLHRREEQRVLLVQRLRLRPRVRLYLLDHALRRLEGLRLRLAALARLVSRGLCLVFERRPRRVD